MKCKLSTLFAFLMVATFAQAQVVISEIMYNPPETGEDSLEYIELLNVSGIQINLQDMKFTAGVTFTFPNYTLAPGQSVVVAKDSTAMKLVFGVSTLQFTGALSNSGEGIVLSDVQDNIVDEVVYDDAGAWPLEADEGGASLVLCDPTLNNNEGANWIAARNNTGIILNGKEMRCSPGLGNAISCNAEPSVFVDVMDFAFNPKDITIDIGTTVRWTNKGGTHNINGNQSVYPNNPASFGNGAPSGALWTYDFTFTKEGVYQYQCDPHAASGMKGTVTVGNPASYPNYTIPLVTTVNQEGVADSVNVKCQIFGIVHGYNLRPGGLQFTLIDSQNNGIGVFNGTTDFGYVVKEGDEIKIKGTINQFNGLTQIIADEVSLVSAGNSPVNPKAVNALNEEDESSLIALDGAFTYVDPAEWKGDGSSYNVNVTNGSQTFLLRIDNDCPLSALPAPVAPFNLKGIVGQFDSSNPFDEGYQIFPRYAADMSPVSATSDQAPSQFYFSPNPANHLTVITGADDITLVNVYDMTGKRVLMANNTALLDVSGLSSGVYSVEILTGKGVNHSKLAVQK